MKDSSGRILSPRVPQKVKRASSATARCNLPASVVPDAFRKPGMLELYKSLESAGKVTKSILSEPNVAAPATSAVFVPTSRPLSMRIRIGGSSCTLNTDESGVLVDQVVSRLVREDGAQQRIAVLEKETEVRKKQFRHAYSAAGRSGLSSPSVSPRSNQRPQSFGSQSRREAAVIQHHKQDVHAVLLFPLVVKRLELWLARARKVIAKRKADDIEHRAVSRYRTKALAFAFSRWERQRMVMVLGRKSSLSRVVRRWRWFVTLRRKSRHHFLQSMLQSIAKHRLHRLFCTWYIGIVAGKAVAKDADVYEAISRRPAALSLLHRRPDIVHPTVDVASKVSVLEAHMVSAITHYNTKALRPPFDGWRSYVFSRRMKHNRCQVAALHQQTVVRERALGSCFHRWRFRMNHSRSLSVYLFRLQWRTLNKWRQLAITRSFDEERIEAAKIQTSKIVLRSCMQKWRRKTNHQSLFSLLGTCRVLKDAIKLLPFAFFLLASGQEASQCQGGSATLSGSSYDAAAGCALAFLRWKKCWQRRRQFRAVVRQQHRMYCALLLKRAFLVWKRDDETWESSRQLTTFLESRSHHHSGTGSGTAAAAVTTTATRDGAPQLPSPPHDAHVSTSGREASDKSPSASAGGVTKPYVTLFGLEMDLDAAYIPWNALRNVERHCRRSYASFGSQTTANSFTPNQFFECEASALSSKLRFSTETYERMDAFMPCFFSQKKRATVTSSRQPRRPYVRQQQGIHATFVTRYDDFHQPAADTSGFYQYLLQRACQALFVVGRIVIASRHAAQQLALFQDLMFSKHAALSHERIRELRETLSALPTMTHERRSSSRKWRLAQSIPSAVEPPPLTAEGRLAIYSSSRAMEQWIDGRDLHVPLPFDLKTEHEMLLEEFATVLTERREALLDSQRRKLLSDSPLEVLALLNDLGFPPMERTMVEHRLVEIASFLNACIATAAMNRISWSMRRTFTLQRVAVADAAHHFLVSHGLAPRAPQPPSSLSPSMLLGQKYAPKRSSSSSRRSSSASASKKRLVFKPMRLSSEWKAVEIAIDWRIRCWRRRHQPEFTAASVVCLVPAKLIVQTIARSQNAPDKVGRVSSTSHGGGVQRAASVTFSV